MGGKSKSSSSQTTNNQSISNGLYGANGVAGDGNTVDNSTTEMDFDIDNSQEHETNIDNSQEYDIEQGDLDNNTGTVNITDGGSFGMVENSVEEITAFGRDTVKEAFGFGSDTVEHTMDVAKDAIKEATASANAAIASANKSTEQMSKFAGETVGDVVSYATDTNQRISDNAEKMLGTSIDAFQDQNHEMIEATSQQTERVVSSLQSTFETSTRANADLAKATANAGQTTVADSAVAMVKYLVIGVAVVGGGVALVAVVRNS